MLIKNRYTFLGIVITALVYSGCISETDINIPDTGSLITVVAHPTPGPHLRASIGTTSLVTVNDPLPDSLFPEISVTDTYNNKVDILRKFTPDSGTNSFWEGIEAYDYETVYSLVIKTPGYPTVTAYTTIPRPITPDITANMDSNPAVVSSTGNIIKQIPLTFKLKDIQNTDSLFAVNILFSKTNNVAGDVRKSDPHFIFPDGANSYLHMMPDHSLLIEKKYWQNNPEAALTVIVVIDYKVNYETPYELEVNWLTASPEYYYYYLSIARQGNIALPFSAPDVLYNNVQGGYGTFSGYSHSLQFVPL